jgi:hypothetical protein
MASGCKATLLVIFLLVAALVPRCVDGSRGTPARTTSPETRSTARLFAAYIPRAKMLPPSGPSERHNSIGQEKEELTHKHP